jgi:vitamin B12/bleomycin/antimicrobial peptide transport system ATP-binding/permease protein
VFNSWYKGFYDAIQQYNYAKFMAALYKFCIIATLYIAIQIIEYYFRMTLEVRWRKWLTTQYIEHWLHNKAYYKSQFTPQFTDNPDQRIAQDVNSFISLCIELILGFIKSITTLVSFVIILWHISGVFSFTFGGYNFIIHGYMVFAALIYAIIGTYITFKIGKPLIKLNYQQEKYEADLRFSLMRVREYSENIAFYNGEQQEKSHIKTRLLHTINNFIQYIKMSVRLDVFRIGYKQIAIIFPIVIAAPRYFTKAIKLGDLIQIMSAFASVQESLSYFISTFHSLSSWRAVINRLNGFNLNLDETKALTAIPIEAGTSYLQIKSLTINLPSQQTLLTNISLNLNAGDRLLIQGKSGVGKTTLLRTIAGLWHFASGHIYQKPGLTSLFISQKPYIPSNSLKDSLCYPTISPGILHDSEIAIILTKCKLSHLNTELNVSTQWGNKLSIGEQQKIAFCRILINRPDIIYLDEATSALDEETEAVMYQTLIQELPQSVIISVGHRSTIKKWHTQELIF